MDYTKIARMLMGRRGARPDGWIGRERAVQTAVLRRLLRYASGTEFGRTHDFRALADAGPAEMAARYAAAVEPQGYEGFRRDVMRMADGARDLLWPGAVRNYAQSSGTTGGRSKYVPVTEEGLRQNHYAGSAYTVAMYLRSHPRSRMFSGKGLILGGSFDSRLRPADPKARVGDLSATLISRINPAANAFRVPGKRVALMADWNQKLPLLAAQAARENVTNLSGVPSWMLRVLLAVTEREGRPLREVWPGLEVFFHGGISFEPYRAEYEEICRGLDVCFFETYNASEGFFAAADGSGAPGMRLLLDAGIYYEFIPVGGNEALGVEDLEPGRVYEMIISTCNGLWRYRLGDTVRVETVRPLRISVAGRTRSFINAFGEELMEDNAERAIAQACEATGATIVNYTAAPVFAHGKTRGRHQWLIEWGTEPRSVDEFAERLDESLRALNSDYDAKRTGTIFLDPPLVTTARRGLFDKWLNASGSRRLGGQRKVPRLSNDRDILDQLLKL